MQVMFNSQERTLREIVALAASSGWKVVKVTKTATSLFGHIVAVPTDILTQKRAKAGSGSAFFDAAIAGAKTRIPQKLNEPIIDEEKRYRDDMETIERASSRCGTPTFGSRMELSSVEEALGKFQVGGGVIRSKGLKGPSATSFANRSASKPAASVTIKKPSPLSVPPLRRSPPLHPPIGKLGSPRNDQSQSPAGPKLIQRRLSLAQLRPQSQQGPQSLSQPSLSATRHLLPLSPMSPRHSIHPPLPRRPSHAQLSQVGHSHSQSQSQSQAPPVLPSLIPVRSEPVTPVSRQEHYQGHATPVVASSRRDSPKPILTRRSSSYTLLPQVPSRKRSGTVIMPLIQTSGMNAGFGAGMPGNSGLIMGVSTGVGALGGAVLFEQERGEGSARSQSPAVVQVGGVSVLAAAAQIERRELSQFPSP